MGIYPEEALEGASQGRGLCGPEPGSGADLEEVFHSSELQGHPLEA